MTTPLTCNCGTNGGLYAIPGGQYSSRNGSASDGVPRILLVANRYQSAVKCGVKATPYCKISWTQKEKNPASDGGNSESKTSLFHHRVLIHVILYRLVFHYICDQICINHPYAAKVEFLVWAKYYFDSIYQSSIIEWCIIGCTVSGPFKDNRCASDNK